MYNIKYLPWSWFSRKWPFPKLNNNAAVTNDDGGKWEYKLGKNKNLRSVPDKLCQTCVIFVKPP